MHLPGDSHDWQVQHSRCEAGGTEHRRRTCSDISEEWQDLLHSLAGRSGGPEQQHAHLGGQHRDPPRFGPCITVQMWCVLNNTTYALSSQSCLRLAGVAYVVASGAKLAFGQPGNVFEVSFEEQASGSSAIFETLLRGMTMGASEDVKRQIQDTLGD